MDDLNILTGIGYMRVMLVHHAAALWFAKSASDRSAHVLAYRNLNFLVDRGFLVKSRWMRIIVAENRIIQGNAYALSPAGVERVRREARMDDESLMRAVAASSPETVSLHTLAVTDALTAFAAKAADYDGKIGVAFWREAPIYGRSRADALIGVLGASFPLSSHDGRGPRTSVPWISWESIHMATQSPHYREEGMVAALYALEIDMGHDTIASFEYRAGVYQNGRKQPEHPSLSLKVAPTPLIVTTTLVRAERIVDIWRRTDSEAHVYATDIASFLTNPFNDTAWRYAHGASNIIARSPFAWIDVICRPRLETMQESAVGEAWEYRKE